ncbi:MAG: DUF2147 domain-containing protein [Saprospiraceae bacterium]
MRILSLVPLFWLPCLSLQAQDIAGVWKTVDDETGQPKSHVQLYKKGVGIEGKIVKLLQKPDDSLCDKCPGERKNKPALNMVILEGMTSKEGMLQGGAILDPESGKWYSCKMWLKEGDPNTLVVRGYLGPFYRTQYWSRVR